MQKKNLGVKCTAMINYTVVTHERGYKNNLTVNLYYFRTYVIKIKMRTFICKRILLFYANARPEFVWVRGDVNEPEGCNKFPKKCFTLYY